MLKWGTCTGIWKIKLELKEHGDWLAPAQVEQKRIKRELQAFLVSFLGRKKVEFSLRCKLNMQVERWVLTPLRPYYHVESIAAPSLAGIFHVHIWLAPDRRASGNLPFLLSVLLQPVLPGNKAFPRSALMVAIRVVLTWKECPAGPTAQLLFPKKAKHGADKGRLFSFYSKKFHFQRDHCS